MPSLPNAGLALNTNLHSKLQRNNISKGVTKTISKAGDKA